MDWNTELGQKSGIGAMEKSSYLEKYLFVMNENLHIHIQRIKLIKKYTILKLEGSWAHKCKLLEKNYHATHSSDDLPPFFLSLALKSLKKNFF